MGHALVMSGTAMSSPGLMSSSFMSSSASQKLAARIVHTGRTMADLSELT